MKVDKKPKLPEQCFWLSLFRLLEVASFDRFPLLAFVTAASVFFVLLSRCACTSQSFVALLRRFHCSLCVFASRISLRAVLRSTLSALTVPRCPYPKPSSISSLLPFTMSTSGDSAGCAQLVSEHSDPPAVDSCTAAALEGQRDGCEQQDGVAVESEGASAMDFTDDLPQLSRLQQRTEHNAASATGQLEAAAGTGEEDMLAVEDGLADDFAADMQQQQQQQEQGQHGEYEQQQDGNLATGQEAVSSTGALLPPPPPPSTQQPPHSSTQAAAEQQSSTTDSADDSYQPSPYMAPLFNHLDTYRAATTARIDRHQAQLREFDRVAVQPWVAAAQRHLKQQEETKRDLTDKNESMRKEIAEFIGKLQAWRGLSEVSSGSSSQVARQQPTQRLARE